MDFIKGDRKCAQQIRARCYRDHLLIVKCKLCETLLCNTCEVDRRNLRLKCYKLVVVCRSGSKESLYEQYAIRI